MLPKGSPAMGTFAKEKKSAGGTKANGSNRSEGKSKMAISKESPKKRRT